MKFKSLLIACISLPALMATAQDRPNPPVPGSGAPAANGQNGANRPAQAPPASKGPKPYKEVITDKSKSQKGLFSVHFVDDKYYLEIGDSLLGREMLVVNRISKAAAEVRAGGGFAGYAGDDISELVVKFEKGPDNKVFMNKMSYRERSKDSTSDMFRSVANSNIQPIVYAFDIKAFSKDSAGSVIDITPLITSDNDILFFGSGDKRSYGLGGLQADKSYVESVRSYPSNLNIRTVKTYSRSSGQGPTPGGFSFGGGGNTDPATYELNNSIILLPKRPMVPRYGDDRVGYFETAFTDFDQNPQGIKTTRYVKRWRLEPKPEDVEKYKRGELVEPAKPIIFYIDPTTPAKWIAYLIQGVNDWQVAFEKAGFKNAIIGKVAPGKQEDSTWSLEDARYSAIVYKPSPVQNASGPSIMDPRTGEILESHINWYHNVMKLLHDWYFVQAAAIDEGARKMQFDDALMGELIRFVSSHEVGHTLGLRHNFGSSSQVPVDNLRNKAWVEANGHTPSIMDYARFNYVAQPEDNISRKGIFPRIGDYDKWAIQWGYKWFPDVKAAEDEKARLNKMVIDSLRNPRLWYGDGETYGDDPRNQTEDLGNNSMKASTYGVKNLQRIVPNLLEWTKRPNEGYADMAGMYNAVVGQFGRYAGHVRRNIGGIQRTPKTTEQPGDIFAFTPKATQKEAMSWLQENIFKTPTWLINPKVSALGNVSPQTTVLNLQNSTLNALISPNTATKLSRFEAEKPAEAYTITEMITDLRKGIFSELALRKPVDIYRRALQKAFTDKVIDLVNPSSAPQTINIGGSSVSISSGPSNTSDLVSIAKAQLKTLQAEIRAAQPLITDNATKYHLADLLDRIEKSQKND